MGRDGANAVAEVAIKSSRDAAGRAIEAAMLALRPLEERSASNSHLTLRETALAL